MKHMQVLKRAWHILWNYRTLWVFGIIIALTTASMNGSQSNRFTMDENNRLEINTKEPILPQISKAAKDGLGMALEEVDLILSDENADKLAQTALRAAIWFVGILIVFGLIGTVFRYIAEVSLIRMVDDFEDTGERKTVSEGFGLGYSREAWRIFLVDLVIELPFIAAAFLLIGLVLVPVLIWNGENSATSLLSLLTSIGLAILLGLSMLAVRAVLAVVKPMIRREISLRSANVGEGIKHGFKLAKQYWKETGLMWLILFGIDVVWPIVMIPLGLLSFVLAGGLGVSVALLIGGEAFTTGDPSMIWAIFVGLGLLIIGMMIPLGFVNGLKETFQSSSWTLTYREINALKSLENGDAPAIEAEAPAA